MKTINTCCGAYVKHHEKTIKTPLPPNPKVTGGIAVIYIGSGNARYKGSGTGSVYHVSDHSRHFKIYSEDAESILKKPDIILKP